MVLFVTMGERDRSSVDGVAVVAAAAGVEYGEVEVVADLAQRVLRFEGDDLKARLEGAESLHIGATRPRAVQALLEFGGVALDWGRVEWVAVECDQGWLERGYGTPWYPVIDRSRCSGCGTCESYCLFSVYRLDATRERAGERVRVASPLNCKTGCPACARLCPEGAIIFPFCSEAALNGGLVELVHREVDELSAVLGDDPMRALAERRKRRQLLAESRGVQADAAERAEAERRHFAGDQ